MHDRQVYDAATAEQQKQQEALNYPSEVEEQDESDNMKEDWELPPTDDSRASDGKVRKFGVVTGICVYVMHMNTSPEIQLIIGKTKTDRKTDIHTLVHLSFFIRFSIG